MVSMAIAWKLVVRPDPGPSPPRFSAQLSWCLLGLVLHPSYAPFLANVWHHQWTSVHAGHSTKTPNAARDGGQAYIKSIFDRYLTFKCSQRWKTSYSKGYSIAKGEKLRVPDILWDLRYFCCMLCKALQLPSWQRQVLPCESRHCRNSSKRCLYPVINGPPRPTLAMMMLTCSTKQLFHRNFSITVIDHLKPPKMIALS